MSQSPKFIKPFLKNQPCGRNYRNYRVTGEVSSLYGFCSITLNGMRLPYGTLRVNHYKVQERLTHGATEHVTQHSVNWAETEKNELGPKSSSGESQGAMVSAGISDSTQEVTLNQSSRFLYL